MVIVHIIGDEKFAPEYIELVNEKFNKSDHIFLILSYSKDRKYVCDGFADNVIILFKDISSSLKMLSWIRKGDKIIFHGLFSRIAMFLVMISGASKKTYSCLWGGDLYIHDRENKIVHSIKKHILTRCRGIAMELEDDYFLTRDWYGAQCKYFPCLLYMSNVVRKKYEYIKNDSKTIRILIGNSATQSNRHKEVLNNLKQLENEDVELIIPLSYGDTKYADEIEKKSKEMFPGKVRVLRDFMPIEDYLGILNEVDTAIFAHKRQQGLGNIISLVSMGKKVYIPQDVTVYKSLIRYGIGVYKTETIQETVLQRIPDDVAIQNINKMYDRFSKEQLIKDWEAIFND